ncbi:hypothetical protein THRCLA_20362 [Thraustotheca clavata]|uniref:Uncharacterized protein n=1 Tax=Thraustotheca clavata TaxID=74557 RepID=A0A1W0A900_9STRA|nr:hypothetical protein THRCLA_20362 [Thraustotheca clavata]
MSETPSEIPAGKDGATFSWNEILRVQNLIERCLQQCMSQEDIIVALQNQANIDPNFTRTVWQKLEEQNPSFFYAYTTHLKLKDQILMFNYLVSQQRDMMIAMENPQFKLDETKSTMFRNELSLKREPLLSPIKTDLDTCSFFT